MLIHSGNHIGDAWYYVENDLIHCFYLTCPDTIELHTAWDIGHAVSSDLVTWEIQELALKKGEPGSYDGICPATGSILRFQDRYWMAYTGNWNGPEPTVALAVSEDLYHWEKCAWNPVTRLDPQYYETLGMEPAKFPHWRDPFLFEHEGAVYHYVCARKNSGANRTRGTVGLAKTHDMRNWEVLPPPEVDPVCSQLEVPQMYHWEGRYYLVFSANTGWFSDAVYARYPQEHFRDAGYSMVGPTPLGPFSMHGTGQILPSEDTPQPYAIQIVFWRGQPYLLGTVWDNDAGEKKARQDFICDPIPVQFTETGVIKKLSE